VVDATRAGSGGCQPRLNRDMQLGRCAALAHLIYMHRVLRVLRVRVFAHWAHVERLLKQAISRLEIWHAQDNRAEAAHLMGGRNRAALPRVRLAHAAVIDQRKPLPLGIFDIQRQAAIALGDLAGGDAQLAQMLRPPCQRIEPGNAQMRAYNRVAATSLARHRPVEEGQIRSWAAQRIGVEQMVGAHVVLIHRTLYEPHPELLRVEQVILANLCRNCGKVMNAGQVHGMLHYDASFK
jgi:hypothetical protein